jgi:DNA adenine methylase
MLEYNGVLVEDPAWIREVVQRCPRCGERATGYIVTGTGHLYFWHPRQGGGKHVWVVGPAREEFMRFAEGLEGPGEGAVTQAAPHGERGRLVLTVEVSLDGDIAGDLLLYASTRYGRSETKVIRYPGGDWFIRDELLKLLTEGARRYGCELLVEVFGGSGVVTMFAPRYVFKRIVYNDKDDIVYSFFKVVRERPEELQRRLILMPYSRRQQLDLRELLDPRVRSKLDEVDKAAIFLYLTTTCYAGGLLRGGFNIPRTQNLPVTYLRKIVALSDLAKRFIDVTLENKDFREIIKLYDTPRTMFYCDPPHFSREGEGREGYYELPFMRKDMQELLDMLSRIKGRFVLKLPEDHLSIPFISAWLREHKYNVKIVETALNMQKAIGEKKERYRHALIYNFSVGEEGSGQVSLLDFGSAVQALLPIGTDSAE